MNNRSRIVLALAAGCVAGAGLPQRAAAVTDEEFNALKDLVTKQGQRIDQLEKTRDQDIKTRERNIHAFFEALIALECRRPMKGHSEPRHHRGKSAGEIVGRVLPFYAIGLCLLAVILAPDSVSLDGGFFVERARASAWKVGETGLRPGAASNSFSSALGCCSWRRPWRGPSRTLGNGCWPAWCFL